MAVIVETGTGVRGANAYAPEAFVASYLASRNRDTEWLAASAAVRAAAVVAATDYIEIRWGAKFKGSPKVRFAESPAEASITFTGVPVAAETIQVGDQVYKFVAALTSPAVRGEVPLGVDATASASNLFDALSASVTGAGTTYSTGTPVNDDVMPTLSGITVRLEAQAAGSSGDYTVLSSAATNVALAGFGGGLDGGPQPLSFPRQGLYDTQGHLVEGIPLSLKQAMAEYADRARVGLLAPDPAQDTRGAVTRLREKVGPIEIETEYLAGSGRSLRVYAYPAADNLLREFLASSNCVIR